MAHIPTDRQIKVCCATFYQSDIVRLLLGDVFHPGGLALTQYLGEVIGLGPADHVLDVACGRGLSAVHLAERFGCHVTGLDYGPDNVAAAEAHAAERGVTHLTTFRQGDAEGLPFDDGTFDAVISECSFCTFPDKPTAAAEMARVLRVGGRLGLTDMTVTGALPDDIQSLLAWVACVAGAGTPEEYVATLRQAGFTDFVVEDHHDALRELVTDVHLRLLGLELAIGLSKLESRTASEAALAEALANADNKHPADNEHPVDLDEAKRLTRRGIELIERGVVGYTLIAARNK